MFHTSTKKLLASVVALAMALSFVVAAPAFADTLPPNLDGESMGGNIQTPITMAICNPTGDSTISFAASGIAHGPYPGTFTEQVTAVVTQPDPANTTMNFPYILEPIALGHTISLHASFTIISGTTTITGTVDLVRGLDGNCTEFDAQTDQGLVHFALIDFRAETSYAATIQTPAGSFASTYSHDGQFGYINHEFQSVPCLNQQPCPVNTGYEFYSNGFVSRDPVTPLIQAQTITFGALANMTYGTPPFDLTATASSGLPVSYSASGPCSVSGSTLSISGVGTCTVTASQAGDTSWAPATDVSQAFAIGPATAIVMGPQAMEGALKVNPGDSLKVGYDFTIPGSHPDASVTFSNATVTFEAQCVVGGAPVTIVVPISNASYLDPAGSSAWYASGDQKSSLTLQGSTTVSDQCAGGAISLAKGGTFTAGLTSTTTNKVNVRWHYSANGSAGGWSGTKSFIPALAL